MPKITRYMDWLSTGLFGLFLICFLSATILPLSSEVVVLLFLSNGYSFQSVFIVAGIANCLGGVLNYYLGFIGHRIIPEKWRAGKKSDAIRKYGSSLAFFSWVPVIGDPLLLAMGFYRTAQFPTMLFMAAGKLIRYAAIMGLWSKYFS